MRKIIKSKIIMDGRLEVMNDGTVFRINNGKREKAKIYNTSRGGRYQVITLQVDGKQKHLYVHRLVADAFIPNPDNKPQVNHKDGNPQNNKVENLEWVTPSENIRHAYRTGLQSGAVRTIPCGICGEPTGAKDGICSICKKAEKKALTEDERKAQIRDTLGLVDVGLLTPLEKR